MLFPPRPFIFSSQHAAVPYIVLLESGTASQEMTTHSIFLFFFIAVSPSLCMVHALAAECKLAESLDNAGAYRACEVGSTRFGRGLVASRDLQPDDVALRIPRSCALIVSDEGDDHHWAGRLAKKLCEVHDSPYTNALPPPPSTPSRGDWPKEILGMFESSDFLQRVEDAQNWRYSQWEQFSSDYSERDIFLNYLDLVCSRTIRVSHDLMLVPYLDMANHASEREGGGYYRRDGDYLCLHAGCRGVRQGEEVTLDYGSRSADDWIMHYGFLPERNDYEQISLTGCRTTISWKDSGTRDQSLQKRALEKLGSFSTSISEDLSSLQNFHGDSRMRLALEFRVSKKMLLSAVAGKSASSPSESSFSSLSYRHEVLQ